MTCYKPVPAWHCKTPHVDTGKPYVVFINPNPCRQTFEAIEIPCTRCIGCRLEHSRQWAIRCVHESSLHSENCFITITYDNEHLPLGGSLILRHHQLFMKRLRKKYAPKIIRFFMCGEYGDNLARPHYHYLLFNHDFADKYEWRKSAQGDTLYRSAQLEKLWTYGTCEIGQCTFKSAAYIARYVTKKITGEPALAHYETITPFGQIVDRSPEFIRMSRNPGIANGWFKQFKTDVYDYDQIVLDGRKMRPPNYYDQQMQQYFPAEIEHIKEERKKSLILHAHNNTPERLAVRERIKLKKAEMLERRLK